MLGDTGETADSLFQMGVLYALRGEFDRSPAFFEEALEIHRARGDDLGISRVLGGLGQVFLNLGHLSQAHTLLVESLNLARRHADRWSSAMSLTLLGHLELARGGTGLARDHLAEASSLFQEIGNPMYLPWCLEGLAGVAASQGDHLLAAQIDGACEALRRQVAAFIPPVNPAAYEQVLTGVRQVLSPQDYQSARDAGALRPLEEVIAAAIAAD